MQKIKGEKFIVTGGSGFIGSHIIEELLKHGKKVINIDLNVTKEDFKLKYWPIFLNSDKDLPNTITIPLDLVGCNDMELSNIMKETSVIFHNAASKCTVCFDNPKRDLLTNAWGSWRVFNEAWRNNAKVIHASTGSVYGECNYQREDNQYAPVSFYGVSKLAGEQYLRTFPGLQWVGLRYFHVYGPRQDNSDKGGVVAIFITKMIKGEPITIYGDGEQTRSFTFVRDVVRANFFAANSELMDGNYYNVASGVSVSLNTLVEMLAEIIGVKPKVIYEPERPGDIKYFNVDNNKIINEGMEPWTSLEDGLRETVEYYKLCQK